MERRPVQKTVEPKTAPTRQATRPVGAQGGISKDAIKRNVGIKKPAGVAPTKPATQQPTERPVRRPAPEKTVEDNPYKTDLSSLNDETE